MLPNLVSRFTPNDQGRGRGGTVSQLKQLAGLAIKMHKTPADSPEKQLQHERAPGSR